MDHREVAGCNAGAFDPWYRNVVTASLLQEKIGSVNALTVWGQGREELKRQLQLADSGAELLAIRPVPGNDRIERPQSVEQRARRFPLRQSQQIETSGSDGSHTVREADERNNAAWNPNLGVIGLQIFERRKGKNTIADAARSYEKPPQIASYFTGALVSNNAPSMSWMLRWTALAASRSRCLTSKRTATMPSTDACGAILSLIVIPSLY